MTMYLSEPSFDISQWNLRRKVLFLHDLCNRKRFFGAVGRGVNDRVRDGQAILDALQSEMRYEIKDLARKLARTDSMELSSGSRVYVDGVRGALREAGWDVGQFDFQQAYLSNFVHSHPVSFPRAFEQNINFHDPSEAQYAAASMALGVSTSASKAVLVRARNFLGENGDPLADFFDLQGNQIGKQ